MMIGFCCATPYHILLSINMANNEFANEDKCLILYNHFKNANSIITRIKKLNIFKRVFLLDDSKKIPKLSYYLALPGELKKILNEYEFCEVIFFALDSLINSQIIKYVIKKNPQCTISLGDDGLGTYLNSELYKYDLQFWKRKLLLKILHRTHFFDLYRKTYIVNPELLTYKTPMQVVKIKTLDFQSTDLRHIVTFLWKNQDNVDYDIVFLQQPFLEDHLFNLEDVQRNAIKILCSTAHNKKISIKVHPRSDNRYLFQTQNVSVQNVDIPFEATLSFSMNKKTLVTIYSTAVMTPFLLAGLTPNIVVLLNLTDDSQRISKLYKFFQKFKDKYEKRGGKIYFPKSYQEYESLIQKL